MFERLWQALGAAPRAPSEFEQGVKLAKSLEYHFRFAVEMVSFQPDRFRIDARAPLLPGYVYGFLDVCSQCMGNPAGGSTSVNAAITMMNLIFDERAEKLIEVLMVEGPKESPSRVYMEGLALGSKDANIFMQRKTSTGFGSLLQDRFADCCTA